jgi:Cellulose biosynthesis protein BcsS
VRVCGVGVSRASPGRTWARTRWWLALVVLAWACDGGQHDSIADDRVVAEDDTPAPPGPSSKETWAGIDATRNQVSIWSGLTFAPFGAIQEPGWRLRTVTGAGRYAYDGWMLVKGLPTPARFHGTTLFIDALVGYHLQIGALTLKPFAGAAMVQHVVTPVDPVSQILGRTVGVKLALDSWLRLGEAAWLNVDGSWTAVHATTSLKARLGYRVWQDLSLGIEASSLSDVNQETRRAGLFLRYAWDNGEVSVGGGVTGLDWKRSWDDSLRTMQPYAGATYLGRF